MIKTKPNCAKIKNGHIISIYTYIRNVEEWEVFQMKKAMVFMAIVLVFLAVVCDMNSSNNTDKGDENMRAYSKNESYDYIRYEEGIYANKDWENVGGYIDEICISNKEIAIKIALSIFENFQKDGQFKNHVVQKVFFDTKDRLWIVSFGENDTLGGDLSIVLRSDNAQVIKMILGE